MASWRVLHGIRNLQKSSCKVTSPFINFLSCMNKRSFATQNSMQYLAPHVSKRLPTNKALELSQLSRSLNMTPKIREINTSAYILRDHTDYQNGRYRSRRATYDSFNSEVERDTLIFSNYDSQFYRSLSFFGIVIFLLLGAQFIFTIIDLPRLPKKDVSTPPAERGFYERIKSLCLRHMWHIIAFIYGFVALLTAILIPLFTLRSVREIWLLRGGERLRLNTYRFMGTNKDWVIPLENTSFWHSRKMKAFSMLFKVKGVRVSYIVDKNKGIFHEPELFDYHVCRSRKLE